MKIKIEIIKKVDMDNKTFFYLYVNTTYITLFNTLEEAIEKAVFLKNNLPILKLIPKSVETIESYEINY